MSDYSAFTSLPQTESLTSLARLAEALRIAVAHQADIEAQLDAAKGRVTELCEKQIPELMDSIGIIEFKLKNGAVLTVKQHLHVSLPKAMKEAAHDWLVKQGFGGLLKHTVEVSFALKDFERAKTLAANLRSDFENVKIERWVEPPTLKAWVADQLKEGKPVPKDLITVHQPRTAEFKKT